ncbi:hypothetical protein BZG36_03832 [Bifiguratus adelaidae]|uniref:Uncharacterized protein n=1 Tax=Bifiguratus adelaidae TaxID=1938954 RepID=A0A261XW87_9FUNG|nr:hypothetical protein BZG36_03832 [Bifiguratus adelaidae]
MNHFLAAREVGLDSPAVLRSAVVTRRTFSVDLAASKEVVRIHRGPVSSLAIEKIDERYILSGGADSSIHIYDLWGEKTEIKTKIRPVASVSRRFGHKFGISGVSWYPFDTGMFISSSFDNTIKIWDTNSLQDACLFDLEAKVYSHAISPIASHCLVACASADPRIRLCDLRTGAFTHSLPGHRGTVMAVQWSPRYEHLLATGGSDHTLRLWDIRRSASCLVALDQHNNYQDPTSPNNLAHNGIVNGLAFSDDGLLLISTGHDERIRLWDTMTAQNTLINYGQMLRNKYKNNLTPVFASSICSPPIFFHPSDDNQVLLFGVFDGKLHKRLQGSYERIACIAWRERAEELYSGSIDHEILVWSPSEDELTETKPLAEQDTWSDDD